ncbi:hypothetical protein [Larkinella insperata]
MSPFGEITPCCGAAHRLRGSNASLPVAVAITTIPTLTAPTDVR